MPILTIGGFEFYLLMMVSVGIACIWPRFIKTDGAIRCRRWLMMVSQLNSARRRWILLLPWKLLVATAGVLTDSWSDFHEQKSSTTCRWWMLQRKAQKSVDSWRIEWKSEEGSWRSLREFEEFDCDLWIVISLCNSVRVVLYILLINNA
jgi:hypothetical protein